MKFKSKFIPIIASCTLIGTIAPVSLASCSKSENESFKYLDLVDEHIPNSFEPADLDDPFVAADGATLAYIDWIQNHKSFFAEDWGYGTYWNWMSTLPPKNDTNPVCYSAKLQKLNVGITEPKFGSTFVQYPGQGEASQYPTISVDVKFHADFTMTFLNQFTHEVEGYPTSSAYDITYSLDTTARLHNMLFFVKTHGLDVNYKEARVINAKNDGINAWNVTTFDRGSNAAYEYRSDDWGIDINSVCHRKIDVLENSSIIRSESCTNSFSANINNVLLFNYVQQILVNGNELFSQLMSLPIKLTDDPEEWEEVELKQRLDNLIDELTGINSSGTVENQIDFLIYTASAVTIDFPSFYFSQVGTPYQFNTFNTLTVTRPRPDGESATLGGIFHFYNYYDEDEEKYENYDYTSWSLEKPAYSSQIDWNKIKTIKLKNDAVFQEINQIGDKPLVLKLTGDGTNKIIYERNRKGYDDDKRPVSPFLIQGTVHEAKPDGTPGDPHAYTQKEMDRGYDSFRLLNTNIMEVIIEYEGSGGTKEVEIPLDVPIATINFVDAKK